jgi:hypothetical protein
MPVAPRKLPPIALLRKELECDFSLGILRMKVARTSRKIGARADYLEPDGYRRVWLGPHRYLAHRLIWALAYGSEPKGWIDHINGNPGDNRISNLRIATHPMNMCNRPAPPHNTSGIKGVHKRRDNGQWRAFMTTNGKRLNLGQFSSRDAAARALCIKRRQLHGEFAKA